MARESLSRAASQWTLSVMHGLAEANAPPPFSRTLQPPARKSSRS